MTRKLFGTDGVRGRANSWPMTAELALKLGAAAGRHFRRDGSSAHRVVIGKDTRLSGYMLENALTAGFTSTGMNVLLLGPPVRALAALYGSGFSLAGLSLRESGILLGGGAALGWAGAGLAAARHLRAIEPK